MGNLLTLADNMAKKRKAIEVAASKLAVKVALTVVGDLAYKTPVDTSQALSNWDVTIGAPADDPHGPYAAGKHGSTYSQSASQTLATAKQTLVSKKPGQVIFITNNLPYIRKLNGGSSTQQPQGFVERAVLLGRIVLKNSKLGV